MLLFDVLKLAAKAFKESGKIPQYEQILEVREKLLEMQEKIRVQDIEIRDLKEKLKIKGEIFFEKNACWIKKKDSSKEGPYCSACWDKDNKLIHLHHDEDLLFCPACKTGAGSNHIIGIIP